MRTDVSTHASAREATSRGRQGSATSGSFNPRLRAGGDRTCRLRIFTVICFNPRLRAGGDNIVSATIAPSRCFNPRLRAGGDRRHLRPYAGRARFQPTPPRGRRLPLHRNLSRSLPVSTHASAREATRGQAAPPGRDRSFNPRLRAGGDEQAMVLEIADYMFRPTPPRGRRPPRGIRAFVIWRVSTHASAREATGLIPVEPQGSKVSTHASAREATSPSVAPLRCNRVSTHASAREATLGRARSYPPRSVSTHASAREATLALRPFSAMGLFQPTPPRGRRRSTAGPMPRRCGFNPRLRAGGDEDHRVLGGCA